MLSRRADRAKRNAARDVWNGKHADLRYTLTRFYGIGCIVARADDMRCDVVPWLLFAGFGSKLYRAPIVTYKLQRRLQGLDVRFIQRNEIRI